MMFARQRGMLFVVSSPSGAGKTTLCRRILDEYKNLTFSVSYTTRAKRAGEQEGVAYHFVENATFDRMVQQEQFAEWAHVHGNRYGTSKRTIEDNIEEGKDVLFDIDWQGATRLHELYPDDTVMVFILPPDMKELERRLRGRGTESEEIVARRLAKAREELEHFEAYDYLIPNDSLEQAFRELCAVYLAARCYRKRRARMAQILLNQFAA